MSTYALKPRTVEAIQWHTGDEPVFDLRGNLLAVEDGEYVSRDTVTGDVEVFAASWFEAMYEPSSTPNVPPAPTPPVSEVPPLPAEPPTPPAEPPSPPAPPTSPWGTPPSP